MTLFRLFPHGSDILSYSSPLSSLDDAKCQIFLPTQPDPLIGIFHQLTLTRLQPLLFAFLASISTSDFIFLFILLKGQFVVITTN